MKLPCTREERVSDLPLTNFAPPPTGSLVLQCQPFHLQASLRTQSADLSKALPAGLGAQ